VYNGLGVKIEIGRGKEEGIPNEVHEILKGARKGTNQNREKKHDRRDKSQPGNLRQKVTKRNAKEKGTVSRACSRARGGAGDRRDEGLSNTLGGKNRGCVLKKNDH